MNEYALFIDGVFIKIKRLAEQPENIPHKNVVWYPVSRTVEVNVTLPPEYQKETTTTNIVGNEYVIHTLVEDFSATEIDNVKTANVNKVTEDYSVEKALAEVLFEAVNEIKILKSEPTITAAQFRNYLKSKI
jgi:hypothetical protein